MRELCNAIERAMILEDTTCIRPASLHIAVHASESAFESPEAADATSFPSGALSLQEQERSLLARALEKTGGNQSRAAHLLRVTRDTLRYKMKKFNLH